MKLIALEIPESPQEIAKWLETVICAGDLRALVAQLDGVHPATTNAAELDEILADQRQALCKEGLSVLPEDRLRALLVQPELLLELQKLVMIEGESYWQAKLTLQGSGAAIQTEPFVKQLVGGPTVQPAESARRSPGNLRLLTLAATILVAVIGASIWQIQQEEVAAKPSGWGWVAEDGVPSGLTAEEYLVALSDGADAWFNKRPANKQQLNKRLTEFRDGCEKLLTLSHDELAKSDRTWLLYKCRGWRVRLNKQLAQLDQLDFEQALQAADKLAEEMTEDLNERSAKA